MDTCSAVYTRIVTYNSELVSGRVSMYGPVAMHTDFTQSKIVPSTIWGLQARKTTLPKAVAIKTEAGTSEKKILSNLIVKSKSSRHP
jgi:hypothetical protein